MNWLSLLLALLLITSVRADEKTEFLHSLAVPLSAAETARLDALIQAKATTEAGSNAATRAAEVADKAVETAISGEKTALQQKAAAARIVAEKAGNKNYAASQALLNFESSKSRRQPLPAEVLKATRPGAVTLILEKLKIGSQAAPFLFHLSIVPRPLPGGSENAAKSATGTPGIEEGLFPSGGTSLQLNMAPSPFSVDVFAASSEGPNSRYRLVNSVQYVDQQMVTAIDVAYLKPKLKQGPMLLLGSNTFRSTHVRLLCFPDGLSGRVVAQYFPFNFGFAAPDKRGIVTIEQRRGPLYRAQSVTDEDWVIRHVWNGQRFVAQPKIIVPKPYLVIGAMSKNRAELEKLRAQQSFGWKTEVFPTSRYPRLPPGTFVLVLSRHKTAQEAVEELKSWKAELLVEKPADPGFKLKVRRGS